MSPASIETGKKMVRSIALAYVNSTSIYYVIGMTLCYFKVLTMPAFLL